MNCRRVRRVLERGCRSSAAEPDSVREHLASCDECHRLAVRLEQVRDALEVHHAAVQPPAGFSAAVLERIRLEDSRRDAVDSLGWAALRLLPVAAVLTALISWSALQPRHGFWSLLVPGIGDDALTVFIASGLGEGDVTPQRPKESQP